VSGGPRTVRLACGILLVEELDHLGCTGSRLRNPQVREYLVSNGSEPAETTVAEFAELIKSGLEKWGAVVKTAGLTPNSLTGAAVIGFRIGPVALVREGPCSSGWDPSRLTSTPSSGPYRMR
jgi:hypothetical protein